VIDVTPPAFHQEISAIALEAGLPVLSEKPLANTLADAVAIVQKANESGVLHMVAQNYRYHVPVQTLKHVLASGEFGRVGSVSVEFFKGPHFGGFREEMAYPLIIDMAIHHFDLMRFLLESDPVTTFGRSWDPPGVGIKGTPRPQFRLICQRSHGGLQRLLVLDRAASWNAHWRF
jgi:predicted dehydrogenase